jgi:NAD(P)-dependent dehydrogenase (short-subunit alcohol dehydrogenase family)
MTSIEPIKPGVALITGASSGIGLAAARALHESGWNVVLVARRKEELSKAVDEMNDGTPGELRAGAIPADLSKEEDIYLVFKIIKEQFGKLAL